MQGAVKKVQDEAKKVSAAISKKAGPMIKKVKQEVYKAEHSSTGQAIIKRVKQEVAKAERSGRKRENCPGGGHNHQADNPPRDVFYPFRARCLITRLEDSLK